MTGTYTTSEHFTYFTIPIMTGNFLIKSALKVMKRIKQRIFEIELSRISMEDLTSVIPTRDLISAVTKIFLEKQKLLIFKK